MQTLNRSQNMKTLKDLLIARKIRKGTAHGTTKRGAFWLLEGKDRATKIRRAGGHGIGNNSSDVTYWLDLRHYRSGEVSAVVDVESWHQNYGLKHHYIRANEVLNCSTVEEVIVTLKGISDEDSPVYSDLQSTELTKTLVDLGLPLSVPSPDEA